MIQYQELFVALDKNKIEYLVAGGVAVNLHQVQRATADLDLILHLERKNILCFTTMMKSLGYVPKLPVDPEQFADPKAREEWVNSKNMMVFSFINPENPFEMIDIFVEEPKPFNVLNKNRLEVKAFDITISVVGLEDLIEMKREAGRDTDLFDIQQLEKLKR